MDVRKKTIICKAVRDQNRTWVPGSLELIAEEPFLVRIDGEAYSVVMRTPGEEICHAAGFCLGEGIIDSKDDLQSIDYDEKKDPNVIDVRLQPNRRKKIPDVLKRRRFVSRTSCGICGKELIEDLYQIITPAADGPHTDTAHIFEGIQTLTRKQEYYKKTRGSHAALILDDRMTAVSFAEDAGRHNALDKAIGKALMEDSLLKADILILSSRTSHELIQKAARARLSIIISHSRPTALAVEMAKDLNLTLGFPDNGFELVVVCGEERIRTSGSKVE
jgi:FdhD protein